ncbi:hypothetical protein FBUS_06306 [Fasciolopsis buskii]|uniref:C3H1-type domain-containing protein n=1 Tax=Fasciolopsis buskii TaxID=27845 RepID=A0A8E0S400_9TREM|nr:hypothetical protein FBUS_06306 [Fasciolopsis buski]
MNYPSSGLSFMQNSMILSSLAGQNVLVAPIHMQCVNYQNGQNASIVGTPEDANYSSTMDWIMPNTSTSFASYSYPSSHLPLNTYGNNNDGLSTTSHSWSAPGIPNIIESTHSTPVLTYFPIAQSNLSFSVQTSVSLSCPPLMGIVPVVSTRINQPVALESPPAAWFRPLVSDIQFVGSLDSTSSHFLMPIASPSEPGFKYFDTSCVTGPRYIPDHVNTDARPYWSLQTGFTHAAEFQSTGRKPVPDNGRIWSIRRRKLGFHNNILFKTKLCHEFTVNGICPRGYSCQFAHGIGELRDPRNHPLYKTTECQNYYITGQCNRGDNCLHLHPSDIAPLSQACDRNFQARSTPKNDSVAFGKNTKNFVHEPKHVI